jgi:murein L,D-transpeptidase YcbB/YkuD
VGRLASQTATQNLGQILGLLVIPILVLWIAYFVHAKRDIDTLTLGLQAVQKAQTAPESGISRQQLTVILAAAGVAFQSELQSTPLAEKTFVQLPQFFQKRDGIGSNSLIDPNQKSTLTAEIATILDQLEAQFQNTVACCGAT